MLSRFVFLAVSLFALQATTKAEDDSHTLPIFFFHGVTANAKAGDNLMANLSTDTRPFVALTFCQDACSLGELNNQTELAIAQIRETVANDKRFANGYTFIGHSQGAALARSVIETMDDHKVHTFISLAGGGNGVFYGPQQDDFVPAKIFLEYFAKFTDPKIYDYSKYTDADISSGKLMIDMMKFQSAHPEDQSQLARSPVMSDWIQYSTFLPKLNNLEVAKDRSKLADQARRKNNFLKLKQAHYFASQYDDTISPWQSSINGEYEPVASIEELEKKFKNLKVLPMTETPEYKQDLYGLQTLDKRGGLFLHVVENVSHNCWVADSTSPRDGKECKFQPVFEKSLYPLLKPIDQASPMEPARLQC